MNDQKIENLLNLALDVSPGEREKSEMLESGYRAADRTWQVIVRYSGNLRQEAEQLVGSVWQITELSGGYAIVTLPQDDLELLASLKEVEYVEKPKRLYFSVEQGRRVSCTAAVQTGSNALRGKDVLIAVIDSGVDYFHPDFRREDGTTRILALWDQSAVPQARGGVGRKTETERGSVPKVGERIETERERTIEVDEGTEMQRGREKEVGREMEIERERELEVGRKNETERERETEVGMEVGIRAEREGEESETEYSEIRYGRTPDGFSLGLEYTKAEIDAALFAGSREQGLELVPELDLSGHGTEVLGIAAGNGRASGGRYRGMAPEADLIVVKLGIPEENGFPRTTELMQAMEYVVRKAEELRRPIAVNLSFGNVYGSHRGNTLLETYLNQAANRWKSVLVAGMGNEGSADGHVSGVLAQEPQVIEFTIGEQERSLSIQLWKNYADTYRITVIHPENLTAGPFGQEAGAARYRLGETELLTYYGEPAPYQAQQEIFFEFIPEKTYLDSGIWKIVLTPMDITDGSYNLWMSDARARGRFTRFLRPSPETTMTIPATAERLIAVGAYDAYTNAYAPFSGRGWAAEKYGVRPDLAAPGVAVTTTASGGGYITVTGTSFASPFVTGAAALLMEWGIVQNQDPFLYGEKVRAYLRKGARKLPGFEQWPNSLVGYGALCVRESLPG